MAVSVYTLKNITEAREFEAVQRRSLERYIEAGNYAALNDIVLDLATAQGAVKVFELLEILEKSNATTLERIEELTGFLSDGADDAGSGRGNDARRAYFDGIRQASSRQLVKLYRQAEKEFYDEVTY